MSFLFITFCVPCKAPPSITTPNDTIFQSPFLSLPHTQYPFFPRQLINPGLLWRWRQQAPSKYWQLYINLHDMIFQKTPILYILFNNNTDTCWQIIKLVWHDICWFFLTPLMYMSTIFMMQLKFVIGYIHTTTQKRVLQTNKSEHFIHLTSTFQKNVLWIKVFRQKLCAFC